MSGLLGMMPRVGADTRGTGTVLWQQDRGGPPGGPGGGHGGLSSLYRGRRQRQCTCAAARRGRVSSPEPPAAAAAAPAAVLEPLKEAARPPAGADAVVAARAPSKSGRAPRVASRTVVAPPVAAAAVPKDGRRVTKKPTRIAPAESATLTPPPAAAEPLSFRQPVAEAPRPLLVTPPALGTSLVLPPLPALALPDAVDDDDTAELEDDAELDWDVLTDEDLDFGPLPDGDAGVTSPLLSASGGPLPGSGRRRPAELDAAAGRDARGWQAILDWELMGFEHEALPDATWEQLKTRVRGLREVWRPMVSYLYSLGLRDLEIARLATKEPQVLSGKVGRARSRVAFLQRSVPGLQPTEMARILTAAPRVMFLRIERTLTKRLQFLQSLGVPSDKVGHVLSRAPALLYHTIATMEPRVQYMCYILRLERTDIGRMVVRHPKLLTANEAMLESRLLFLFQLGLDDEAVRRMVRSHPQLLNYTPDCMAPRVAWLTDEVGMTPDEVAHTVSRLSQVFGLSVENSLRPKYEYLTSELGGTKRSLLECPTYLSLSLAQRIVPRHRFLVHRGCAATPFNLWELIHGDARFLAGAKATPDEYLAFRERLASGVVAR